MAVTVGLWFSFALAAHAAVSISEVAWMGTAESQYGEWIEFYNDSDTDVSLAGWKLYQDGGGTLVFTMTKTIPAKGYFVIERTTASTPDPLHGIADEAGAFGGGGLSNSGEHLVLKDAAGTTVDDLNFQSGWPAGDATTKQTMQKLGTKWITDTPTPKAATVGTVNTGPTDTGDDNPAPVLVVQSSHGSQKIIPKDPKITFSYPAVFAAGVPVTITAMVQMPDGVTETGYFLWNTGDGYSYELSQNDPLTHTYAYPGTYIVTLAYTAPIHNPNSPDLVNQFTLTVVDPSITVEQQDQSTVFLANKSKETIDLSAWVLRYGAGEVVFPRFSSIAAGARIAVPATRFNILAYTSLPVLYNPSNQAVTGVMPAAAEQPTFTNTYTPSDARIAANPLPITEASNNHLALTADAAGAADDQNNEPKNNQRTGAFIALGALIAVSIGLYLLLERFKARQE